MIEAATRLGRPSLAPLVDELARRFGEGPDPARLTLRGLPLATRRALADLLGSDRLVDREARVAVPRLLAALRLDTVGELRAVVQQLRGPLPDRRAELAADRAARDQLWSWLDAEAARLELGGGPGSLRSWAVSQRALGRRGGVVASRRRFEVALSVLRALPADGVSLSSLASDNAGNPHALDHGLALPALVLDAVATAFGAERPANAEAARTLWETVGVAPDPLSSTVLALGLPGGDENPLRRWLADAAAAGEPVVLTLAHLRRWPLPPLAPAATCFVVENPSLIVEAAAMRWHGPPLVCSSGRPTVATLTLLRQLAATGARAYQHADFDPAGLGITRWLADHAGTVPWRMGATDYLAHAAESQAPISGHVPETEWDPDLRAAMQRAGRAVYEEQVRGELLSAMVSPDQHAVPPQV